MTQRNDTPTFVVTAARVGAWQKYQQQCKGYDISPGEFLPLKGKDIYTVASNGAAEALRNLTASDENTADELRDSHGNRYSFNFNAAMPLGDSLLRYTTLSTDIIVPVTDAVGITADQHVRLVAKIHGQDDNGPVMINVRDSQQDIEDLMESTEWRMTMALAPQATRIRYYNLSGQNRTIINIRGERSQHWNLFRLETSDQFPYQEMVKQVHEQITRYLSEPHNASVSATAAQRLMKATQERTEPTWPEQASREEPGP